MNYNRTRKTPRRPRVARQAGSPAPVEVDVQADEKPRPKRRRTKKEQSDE